jgi:hypothetical protein
VTAATGHGQSILLRGDAGIGKTRLLEEFRDMAERSGFTLHMGQVLDFGARVGADAIGMTLLSLLNCAADVSEAERREKAEAALGEKWLDDAERIFLYSLLGLPLPEQLHAAFDAMDNDLRVSGQERAVAEIMRARRWPADHAVGGRYPLGGSRGAWPCSGAGAHGGHLFRHIYLITY